MAQMGEVDLRKLAEPHAIDHFIELLNPTAHLKIKYGALAY
jgi:hypothetical protein